MSELSKEAGSMCANWFAWPKNILVCDPSHEALNRARDAMAELMAAGIVTQEHWNSGIPTGWIVFRGSPAAAQIAREVIANERRRSLPN